MGQASMRKKKVKKWEREEQRLREEKKLKKKKVLEIPPGRGGE
jgi:hypothetical protein